MDGRTGVNVETSVASTTASTDVSIDAGGESSYVSGVISGRSLPRMGNLVMRFPRHRLSSWYRAVHWCERHHYRMLTHLRYGCHQLTESGLVAHHKQAFRLCIAS